MDADTAAPLLELASDFLDASPAAPHARLAVIALNWSLPALTPRLLAAAAVAVAADGGANRLYDAAPAWLPDVPPDEARARLAPHAVVGDLDSVRPEVAAFYRRLGGDAAVRDLSADQMTTDFQKALAHVRAAAAALEAERAGAAGAAGARGADAPRWVVVALGALGGRLDHLLSNLSAAHAAWEWGGDGGAAGGVRLEVVLLGDGNLARVLPAGRARLTPRPGREGPGCGLVPLAGRATVSSAGLRYDMDGLQLEMGGLVSSSNAVAARAVEVATSAPLVWSTDLRDDDDGAGGGDAGGGG